VVKVTDPRSVSELSDVLFLSWGNVDEPKVVGIGPKQEFYQGVVAFFIKGLAEFEEIKQISQHYWGFAPAVYLGILGDVTNRQVGVILVELPESVGFEVHSGVLTPLFFS